MTTREQIIASASDAGLQLIWDGKFGREDYHSIMGSFPSLERFYTTAFDAGQKSLRQQLADRDVEAGTAWAQAHRLALELECLLMDTKDNAVVSKWWDSAHEAMDEYHNLKPGAVEDAEARAKIRNAATTPKAQWKKEQGK